MSTLPMIGRQNILDKIRLKIDENWGEREIICLSGAGGIGKTRMLQEIRELYKNITNPSISSPDFPHPCMVFIQEDGRGEWAQLLKDGVVSMAKAFKAPNIEKNCYDAQGNSSRMVDLLRDAIEKKSDAILIQGGTYSDQIRDLINQTASNGITVALIDNYSQGITPTVIKISHNESDGIRTAAFHLRDSLKYVGEIAIFRNESDLHKNREQMFKYILSNYPDIHFVATETPIQTQNVEAAVKERLDDVRRRFPHISAIVTRCDDFSKPLASFLNKTNIRVYSFDLDQRDVELMTAPDSPRFVTVTTEPFKSGRILVRLAMQQFLKEERIQSNHPLNARVITQEEMRQKSNIWQDDDDEYGWTPKLRALVAQQAPTIRLSGYFDFDDRSLRNEMTLERKIAAALDENMFKPFFKAQASYFNMQNSGGGQEGLNRQKKAMEDTFFTCFEQYSERERPIFLFDTFDKRILTEKGEHAPDNDLLDSEIGGFFKKALPRLKNLVILIAGRQAHILGNSLKPTLENDIDIISLQPLSLDDSRTYLRQKAQSMFLFIEGELIEKLLYLSAGKPILLDLAVELRGRGIVLDWLVSESIEQLRELEQHPAKKEQRITEFEQALVRHVADLRTRFDELIVLLSYIHPMNADMVAMLLSIPHEDADTLVEKAQGFMFIKLLPDGFFKLHDEMERMIENYVLHTIVDPEKFYRAEYSKKACAYYTNEIARREKELLKRREQFEKSEQQKNEAQTQDRIMESLTIRGLQDILWDLKEDQLRHTLFTDLQAGVALFYDVFNEAGNSHIRQQFFDILQKYENENTLEPDQKRIRDIARLKLWSKDTTKRDDAIALCERLIEDSTLTESQKIDLLLERGNLMISSGNVPDGLKDFKTAVKKSEAGYKNHTIDVLWLIKSEKELGWAHRAAGSFEQAITHYQTARKLCLKHGGSNNKALGYDYGMILNNLAFVLSDSRKTREAAESSILEAIRHWKKIGHNIGLGAAYIVLGVVYYREGEFERALNELNKAIEICTPLGRDDLIAQAYAWRGATYRVYQRDNSLEKAKHLDAAEKDLTYALSVDSKNYNPMIHNRLGRVWMERGQWEKAEDALKKSFELAKNLPDYIYGLVSLSRLMMVAAEKGEYERLEKFEQELTEYASKIPEPEKNNYGIAYIALARLAFGQNKEENISKIIEYLQEGIRLVTEYGSYANRDGLSRLKIIEKEFRKERNPVKPYIIRQVGSALFDDFLQKEDEDFHYNSVTILMNSWAHWGDEGGQI